jgi:gamma-carbonic anhydrase
MANDHLDGVSIITLHGHTPRIHETAFVAPGCRIIGDVEIGEGASVWYNCVLRGQMFRTALSSTAIRTKAG